MDLFATLEKSAKTAKGIQPKKRKQTAGEKKQKPKTKKFYDISIHYNRSIYGFTIKAYGDRTKDLAKLGNIIKTKMYHPGRYYGNAVSKGILPPKKHGMTAIYHDYKLDKSVCRMQIAANRIPPRRYGIFCSMIEEMGIHQYSKVRTVLKRLLRERYILSLPHGNMRVVGDPSIAALLREGMIIKHVTSSKEWKVVKIDKTGVHVETVGTEKTEENVLPVRASIFDIVRSYHIDVNERRNMISKTFKTTVYEDADATIERELAPEYERNVKRLEDSNVELWDCQIRAVARACLKPFAILHAAMGLGKSRMYPAACRCYGSKMNLIITEPQLCSELQRELSLVGIPSQTIKKTSDLKDLIEFNIISFTALQKKSSRPGRKARKKREKGAMMPYRTLADDLKKIRFGVLVIDECHNIKNHISLRYKYLRKLKWKKVVLGSGTIIGGSFGDMATYVQLMLAGKVKLLTVDGDVIRDSNLCATMSLLNGGYREKIEYLFSEDRARVYTEELLDMVVIDRVKQECYNNSARLLSTYGRDTSINLGVRDNFRNELQGNRFSKFDFQRVYDILTIRLRHDHPDVLSDVEIPPHEEKIVSIKPTIEHIKVFRKVMDDIEAQAEEDEAGGIAMFHAIRLLIEACDVPQKLGISDVSPKQEAIVNTVKGLCKRSDKIMCFTTTPLLTEVLETEMKEADGVKPVALYSSMDVDKRNKLIDTFRFGDKNVLISPYSLCGRGYNIPQASIVVEASQTWSVYHRAQAMARIIRPQQKKHPVILRFKTVGLMDDYMINHSVIREANMELIPDGIEREVCASGPRSVREVIANVRRMLGDTEEEDNE